MVSADAEFVFVIRSIIPLLPVPSNWIPAVILRTSMQGLELMDMASSLLQEISPDGRRLYGDAKNRSDVCSLPQQATEDNSVPEDFAAVQAILKTFGDASRLRTNIVKSVAYPTSCDGIDLSRILCDFGGVQAYWPRVSGFACRVQKAEL
ncbi:uncharacterized protein [Triticum aestivum]|uniref:uncharacterized protein n=1 Tax=Triticum aestivum TaxID=4565 RepID=UPI001D009CAA|nr:uncharacterized protein LOC123141013 [Triticum aestivum]